MNDTIAEALESDPAFWMHAYTYSAHPVGCAVALRTLRIIDEEDFPGAAAEKGAALLARLRSALADHPHVGEVRGQGLMCGVELVQDKATKAEFPPQEKIGTRVQAEALERGLFKSRPRRRLPAGPADHHHPRAARACRGNLGRIGASRAWIGGFIVRAASMPLTRTTDVAGDGQEKGRGRRTGLRVFRCCRRPRACAPMSGSLVHEWKLDPPFARGYEVGGYGAAIRTDSLSAAS